MFGAEAKRAIAARARAMGVEPAALLAVAEVESGGRATARVEGRDEPLIRFEGHYFHRLLPPAKRRRALREGLASPRAGAVRNPRTQAARYRMLARARAIDREAADQSVSWGLGQVMGANWRALGYGSVDELVADARAGVAGQVRLMTRFIEANGLAEPLRARDWRAFARAYNGPAYARHDYHGRMARAHARYRRSGANALAGDDGPSPSPGSRPAARGRTPDHAGADRPTLRRGARGESVRDLQILLGARADGAFGPATLAAVRRFQSVKGLTVDGVVGSRTWAALEARAARRAFRHGLAAPWRWIVRLVKRTARAISRADVGS